MRIWSRTRGLRIQLVPELYVWKSFGRRRESRIGNVEELAMTCVAKVDRITLISSLGLSIRRSILGRGKCDFSFNTPIFHIRSHLGKYAISCSDTPRDYASSMRLKLTPCPGYHNLPFYETRKCSGECLLVYSQLPCQRHIHVLRSMRNNSTMTPSPTLHSGSSISASRHPCG